MTTHDRKPTLTLNPSIREKRKTSAVTNGGIHRKDYPTSNQPRPRKPVVKPKVYSGKTLPWMSDNDPSRQNLEHVKRQNQIREINYAISSVSWSWNLFKALPIGVHNVFPEYIRNVIIPMLPEEYRNVSNRTINEVLHTHCQHKDYLKNLRSGNGRYSIEGEKVGVVDEGQQQRRMDQYSDYWKRHPRRAKMMTEARRRLNKAGNRPYTQRKERYGDNANRGGYSPRNHNTNNRQHSFR